VDIRDSREQLPSGGPARCDDGDRHAPVAWSCRACGACCALSRDWPRFSTEDDAALALIPRIYVDDADAGMRCVGHRCAALTGEVGVSTSCTVYSVRPDVCRACEPGDGACLMARERFGL
jgi:hypothetical protein